MFTFGSPMPKAPPGRRQMSPPTPSMASTASSSGRAQGGTGPGTPDHDYSTLEEWSWRKEDYAESGRKSERGESCSHVPLQLFCTLHCTVSLHHHQNLFVATIPGYDSEQHSPPRDDGGWRVHPAAERARVLGMEASVPCPPDARGLAEALARHAAHAASLESELLEADNIMARTPRLWPHCFPHAFWLMSPAPALRTHAQPPSLVLGTGLAAHAAARGARALGRCRVIG